MAYPSMNDYQTYIQKPSVVFTDTELQQCQLITNQFGLPQVSSGGFALTYCLCKGNQKWAVRCFHKEALNLQDRYNKISTFLKRNASNYFVYFEYQSNGIKVNRAEYPIIKMDWVSGASLNTYIENNLTNNQVISKLQEQFRECVSQLEKMGIAHGDLQHGNIVVCNEEIKLIDYDGIYVPGMSYSTSNEIGHVNYQHPLRDEKSIGTTTDRFSAIVIYLALEAIKVKPKLWDSYDNGENLLFKRQDFIFPNNSPLIKELIQISSLKLQIENFTKLCRTRLNNIPSLEDFIKGNVNITLDEVIDFDKITSIRKRQYSVFSTNDLPNLLRNVGNIVEVVGLVTDVSQRWARNKKPYIFINFSDINGHFKLILWSEALNYYNNHKIDIYSYKGKWISVTQLITAFNDKPQMVIDRSTKIIVLKDEKEANNILSDNSILDIVVTTTRNKDILKSIGAANSKNTVQNQSTPMSKNQKIFETIKGNQSSNTNNTVRYTKVPQTSNIQKMQTHMRSQPQQQPQRQPLDNQNSQLSKKKSNCFIATEVYGSGNTPEVMTLRNWRDSSLRKTYLGRSFIKFYYKNSPQIVKSIRNKPLIKKTIKTILDCLIRAFLMKYSISRSNK